MAVSAGAHVAFGVGDDVQQITHLLIDLLISADDCQQIAAFRLLRAGQHGRIQHKSAGILDLLRQFLGGERIAGRGVQQDFSLHAGFDQLCHYVFYNVGIGQREKDHVAVLSHLGDGISDFSLTAEGFRSGGTGVKYSKSMTCAN